MTRLALLLPLVSLLAGCTPCTLIGCGPSVQILIGSADDPFDPAAEYTIELDLDGEQHTVVCNGQPECEVLSERGDFRVSGQIAFDSSSTYEIQIHSADELAPENISIVVLAADTPIYEGTHTPAYADEEINGEGCGVCRSADAPIVLPGSAASS